jgi:hypothetical protein
MAVSCSFGFVVGVVVSLVGFFFFFFFFFFFLDKISEFSFFFSFPSHVR